MFDFSKVPPTAVPVTLSLEKFYSAHDIAMARLKSSISRKLKQKDPKVENNWIRRYVTDLCGVLGEMAVIQHGKFSCVPTVNKFNHTDPDIPPDLEVRHTLHPRGGLIVRSDDKKERRFILVTGVGPVLFLVGWAYGHEVVVGQHWKTNDDGSHAWKRQWNMTRTIKSLELY